MMSSLAEPILHFQCRKTTTNPLKGPVIADNVLITIICKQGRLKEALQLLCVMDSRGNWANSSTYGSLLQCCLNDKTLPESKLVHAHVIQTGYKFQGIHLQNKLLSIYAKCGILADAHRVLNEMTNSDVVSWTAVIAAYVRHGFSEEALTLYYQMQRTGIEPDKFTFATVLPACHSLPALEEVYQEISRRGLQWDVFVGSALVDMYAKCGSLEDARQLFDKMPQRNVVSWNVMIAGYARNGLCEEALKLFHTMPERNVVSWTTMIAAYAQSGHIDEAVKLFHEMPERNVASWNAVIAGYSHNGCIDEALELFHKMPERNVISWTTVIAGCAQNGRVDEARALFLKAPERNVVSWTALIAGYAQTGHVDEAFNLFERMTERNAVSWNAMIAGFAKNGHHVEALKLFQQMRLAGPKPDSETFTSVLPVCANLTALEQGKEIHEEIITRGFQCDISVGNALVDMYSKCGSIENAQHLFDKMSQRDVVSWTLIITGYAMHGRSKDALKLFEQMQQAGTKPDGVTFVGVLSACCHAGLVAEGWQYFNCMTQYYSITPTMEHYGCMVDLLGRAGHLDEAHNFIKQMPIKPDASVWGCLLGACTINNNIELGKYVSDRLLEIDSKNTTPYVLLSNIYAAAGRWNDIANVRKMMKDRGVKKYPGCSWIEVNKQVYTFCIEDRSHLPMQKI
jgi:pentatricopeptide repeat protein